MFTSSLRRFVASTLRTPCHHSHFSTASSTASNLKNVSIPVSDDFADEAGYTRLAQNLVAKRHTKWTPGRFTVFYDGSCPLCSREIQHYKNLSTDNDVLFLDLFDYTQLTTVGSLLSKHEIKLEDARKRMHVLTEDEKIVRNAEAFVEIWRRMPYWRMLIPFVDNFVVLRFGNSIYDVWAERRWKSREEMDESESCSIGKKDETR
jgi:predicted DCC family thiol-disulfide oxidoreductase YuxK